MSPSLRKQLNTSQSISSDSDAGSADENILLKEENKSGIKIIDFGSSTFIDEKVYTYI